MEKGNSLRSGAKFIEARSEMVIAKDCVSIAKDFKKIFAIICSIIITIFYL